MEKLLGKELFQSISALGGALYEIRLRLFRPIMVKTEKGVRFLERIADETLLNGILDRITDKSYYAYEEQISHGYVEYGRGFRIGVIGESRYTGQKVALRRIYSLCIRIPHEIIGCASKYISDDFLNTLIVSPPFAGKTTLLRDFCRLLSYRYDVLVVDERYEICGSDLSMKMGERCDVVQGVSKDLAYETAVRTMAPEIVACDELFGKVDLSAIKKLSGAGIKVIATYHADGDVDEELKEIFPRRIYLSKHPFVGTVVKTEGI